MKVSAKYIKGKRVIKVTLRTANINTPEGTADATFLGHANESLDDSHPKLHKNGYVKSVSFYLNLYGEKVKP